jgi:hypothetical protein
MEGLLSTAIGLSGTPKDYTALQAARERQKGVEQQRKQLARDKELDELRKGLVVKDGFYLPGRYEDVERYTAEAVDNMVKALESGDRRELAQLQSKYFNTMNGWNEERKQIDELAKKVQSGEVFLGTDINNFYGTKDFKQTIQKLAESGEVIYDPQNPNLPIKVQAFKSYDKPEFFKGIEDSLPRNQFREETFMVNGKQVVQQVFSGNEEDLKYTLADYFESNPNIKKGEFLALKRLNPNATDEQILQEAKRRWVDDGVMYMKEKRRNLGGGGITVNTGDTPPVPAEIDFTEQDVITASGLKEKESLFAAKALKDNFGIEIDPIKDYNVKALVTSQAPYKTTTVSTSGIRDVYSGQDVTKSQVIQQTYNQTAIIPVFRGSPNSKFNGIAIPSKIMDNPKAFERLKNKGQIEYIAVAVGDKGYTVPLKSVRGAGYLTESKGDQAALKGLYKRTDELVEQKNSELKSGKTTPTNEQPTQTQPTQAQPKQTQAKQPANVTSGGDANKWKKYKVQGNIK